MLTSLAFGALHSDMLAGTLAGAGFAVLVLRTGRVGDAIIAHTVTNFLLAVTAMATGRSGKARLHNEGWFTPPVNFDKLWGMIGLAITTFRADP